MAPASCWRGGSYAGACEDSLEGAAGIRDTGHGDRSMTESTRLVQGDERWLICEHCGNEWPEDEIDGDGRCPDCAGEEDGDF